MKHGVSNKESFIYKRPVRLSQNVLLEAIRETRKSNGDLKWSVLGVIRVDSNGGKPAVGVVIINDKLVEAGYYDPKEYDVLVRVNDYKEFLHIHKMTRQDQMVGYITGVAKTWEMNRKKELYEKAVADSKR